MLICVHTYICGAALLCDLHSIWLQALNDSLDAETGQIIYTSCVYWYAPCICNCMIVLRKCIMTSNGFVTKHKIVEQVRKDQHFIANTSDYFTWPPLRVGFWQLTCIFTGLVVPWVAINCSRFQSVQHNKWLNYLQRHLSANHMPFLSLRRFKGRSHWSDHCDTQVIMAPIS